MLPWEREWGIAALKHPVMRLGLTGDTLCSVIPCYPSFAGVIGRGAAMCCSSSAWLDTAWGQLRGPAARAAAAHFWCWKRLPKLYSSARGCMLSPTALAAPSARLQGKQQVLHFPAHPALPRSKEALPTPLRAGRKDAFLFFMLFFLLIQFKKQKQMKAAWILAAQEKL